MKTRFAQGLLYGGAFAGLASAFAELQTAHTWAEVMTPSHVFGALSALIMTVGALMHPVPGQPKAE
jgi:hypothetical protein